MMVDEGRMGRLQSFGKGWIDWLDLCVDCNGLIVVGTRVVLAYYIVVVGFIYLDGFECSL